MAACYPLTGCGEKDAADGAKCADSDPCTSGETCTAGICHTPSQATECYIDNVCYAEDVTQSTCHVCKTSLSTTTWSRVANTCEIKSTCYVAGDTLDACHSCDPSVSPTAWTLAKTSCYIGGTCHVTGDTSDACHSCLPSTSQTAWTLAKTSCYIDGVCYAAGAAGPNTCTICTPAVSQTTWTHEPGCGNDIVLVALNEAHTGDLSGVSGANALCQQQATAANFSGTFKAFLSSSTQNVIDVVTATSASFPVYNSRGEKLFTSWTAMFPAKWPTGMMLWSFDGKEVNEGTGASPDWDDADVWHGSTGTGAVDSKNTCKDWTASVTNAACGEADSNTMMTLIEIRNCSLTLAVLCVRIP
ncbi:MAG: hypothetical protein KAI66_27820 [Lentisphaeria bacterium]|nr:hypothetical protein [Lentisphaeria bacterium]